MVLTLLDTTMKHGLTPMPLLMRWLLRCCRTMLAFELAANAVRAAEVSIGVAGRLKPANTERIGRPSMCNLM